jgi:hypothetical protein
VVIIYIRIKLRAFYSYMIQYQSEDGNLNIHQIPSTSVIKPDFDYYKKDKKANYNSLSK